MVPEKMIHPSISGTRRTPSESETRAAADSGAEHGRNPRIFIKPLPKSQPMDLLPPDTCAVLAEWESPASTPVSPKQHVSQPNTPKDPDPDNTEQGWL